MEMDALAALRLQIEWGADEALLDAPLDRLSPAPVPGVARAAPALATIGGSAPAAAPGGAAGAATLADLQAELDRFDACPLRATAANTVAPSGNPAAGLVLVADVPDEDDDRSGTAFSGRLGALLDRVLGSAGLDRDAMLVCHAVPWRPPGGRPVNEAEMAVCLPFLHRLLALARPRHLVLMGGGTLKALTGDTAGLRRARGRWTEAKVPGLGAVPALPMLPPDQWLASATSRQATWADLMLLRARMESS